MNVEPSAAPDHDWNTRIDRECYARLASAEVRVAPTLADRELLRTAPDGSQRPFRELVDEPVPDSDIPGGLARLVNCYAWCSFDVGATLCEWLEVNAPLTYRAMQLGDAASAARLGGHGNAIASPYHHIILPLASRRDKVTEVRWGIADFERRFRRKPHGFWLPETAVDEETLDVLAEHDIAFTILAPYQVRNPDPSGRPLRYRSASGRELAIFTYDGGLAGEVAFGGLLRDPIALAAHLAPLDPNVAARTTILATDGETFGHHHRGGEVTLARAIARIAARENARVHNCSSRLAEWPPIADAQLVSPSSWSCAHGVERWRSDCGCRLDANARTSQEWRGPLRRALNWLAGEAHNSYLLEATPLFRDDPWAVRDAYGAVVAKDGDALTAFVHNAVRDDRRGDARAVQRGQELLELERAALRLFTSCAWFFDDVSRIEARQVLGYAARVLELSGRASRLEEGFVSRLAEARSNYASAGTAADVFVRSVLPHRSVEARVAAAAAALAADGQLAMLGTPARLGAYDLELIPGDEGDMSSWEIVLVHRRTNKRAEFQATALSGGRDAGVPRVSVRRRVRGLLETPLLYDVRDYPELAARALLETRALNPFPDAPFESFEPR